MHEFLVAICPPMLWIFAVCHLAFIVLFALRYAKTKRVSFLLCALVSFGLFYDALMLAFGTFMKAGAAYEGLSQVRFISHGALIPLLFALTAFALDLNKKWKIALVAVTGVLVVLGIAEGFATVLELKEVGGIIRYTSSKELTPAWAAGISSLLSYGAVAPLIVGGIYDWAKNKTPHLFLSGILMFVFAAIGPAFDKEFIFFISMFGEFFMMLFLLFSLEQKEKKRA